MLEKTEPVGDVDRVAKISDSLMPSVDELRSELGMLPVTPTTKACNSGVRRSRRNTGRGNGKAAVVTENEESEDHKNSEFVIDDSDANVETEAQIIDLQLGDDQPEHDESRANDPVLNVRS